MFPLKRRPKTDAAPAERSTPAATRTPKTPTLKTSITKSSTTKERGQIGEDAAALFLQQRNFQIIARNWRPGNVLRGEIDIIAWTRDARGQRVLCFVEVKARSSNLSSSLNQKSNQNQTPLREIAAPQEAVTLSKQRQIARLASAYVSLNRLDDIACRFDVVEVWLQRDGAPLCSLCENAFDYC